MDIFNIFTARCSASEILAMGLCPSVTSQCSIETAQRIELVFGMWASFHPSYTVLKGNSVISKNKGTSPWNCPKPQTKLGHRRTTKSIIPPTLDHYSLSHRSSSAVYGTILSHGSISDSWYLVQDLSYKYFLHCCVAIGKISTDMTHRAVPQR